MKHIITLFLFVTSACFAQNDLLREALSSYGLDSSDIGFRPQSHWGAAARSDAFRLPYFDGLLAHPLRIPTFSKEMIARYTVAMTADSANMGGYQWKKVRPAASMIVNSARNLGLDIGRVGFDYTPAVPDKNPLTQVVLDVFRLRGGEPGTTIVYPLPTQNWSDIRARYEKQIQALPLDLQRSIASLLAASLEAAGWRDKALSGVPRDKWKHIFESTILEEAQCDAHAFDQAVYDAALAYDNASGCWGAALLSQAVEKEIPNLMQFRNNKFTLDIETPLGRVVLSGGGSDRHYAQDCVLLIDLGGDDTYFGSAAASNPGLPVSVVIDLGGDDVYENRHAGIPSQGAGVLGYGMLFDLEGNDVYESRTFSQGCGRFGVGLLVDNAGRDVYKSEGFSQGAGMYGVGILYDAAGDDRYNTVYYAQGYGFARGLGLLADMAGDDAYVADDETLTHVGDETPLHNESDAQGFGAGRRGDHTDGHNMSGGIGILNDLAGNDSYNAGVFGQGCGYWYGYGILNDHAGDDNYKGVFFNLGAAAHFSIGALFDDAGNDRTDLVMTLGLGTAHDCSAAFYMDLDGDDSYMMSKADERSGSLGSALNSSFALFLNIRGNDSYAPVGNSLGWASSRRGGDWAIYAPTTGIFIDIGGNDTYTYRRGQNDTRWTNDKTDVFPGVHGTGIDAPVGGVGFEN
jgi:hypothetical protein